MANTRHRGGPKTQALPGRKCALLVKSPKFQQLAAGPGLEYCATARDCLIPQSIANHDGACRDKSRRLIFAAILGCASVFLALVFANVFPDQTWAALNTTKTLYAETASRMIPVPTGASRRSEEDRIREAVFRDLIGSTVRGHVLTIDG